IGGEVTIRALAPLQANRVHTPHHIAAEGDNRIGLRRRSNGRRWISIFKRAQQRHSHHARAEHEKNEDTGNSQKPSPQDQPGQYEETGEADREEQRFDEFPKDEEQTSLDLMPTFLSGRSTSARLDSVFPARLRYLGGEKCRGEVPRP